jgi:hypothetical protein
MLFCHTTITGTKLFYNRIPLRDYMTGLKIHQGALDMHGTLDKPQVKVCVADFSLF